MPAENGIPENEEVKSKAMVRLIVAGAVTAAALGGLWWLDQSGGEQKKPTESLTPTPIVSAPQIEAPIPEAETPEPLPDEEESDGTEVQDEVPDDVAIETAAKTKDLPPPPRVSNNLGGMPRSPTPIQPAAPQPAPKPTARPLPATPATPMQQPASGQGFVVQLGIFNNTKNASELVEKLNKQGIRAHLEARVQIGPFLNRQEAEKAQIEMGKLGYNALVTLPYSAAPATK